MNTPKSIDPDRIVDAFVEVRYESNLPFEVVIGTIFHKLDESYTYTNRPVTNNQINLGNLNFNIGGSPLFFNDKIKIMLMNNSILFNILSNYIGWAEYIKQIEKVLIQITREDSPIVNFTRASVRYISEYEEINLQDCFKFNFSFGMPNVRSEVFTFRSEFEEESLKIFLNFQNNVKLKNRENKKVSTVDIDVLNENIKGDSLKDIIEAITTAHNKQKNVFFTIINQDYLQTLKPKY